MCGICNLFGFGGRFNGNGNGRHCCCCCCCCHCCHHHCRHCKGFGEEIPITPFADDDRCCRRKNCF